MNNNKYSIGIDIGSQGAISIQGNGKFALHKMPLKDKQVDFKQVFKLLNYFKPNNCHICFEDVKNMFGSQRGTYATWSLAEQTGTLQGILIALKLPYTKIHPRTWQKEMFAGIETKKTKETESLADSKLLAYFSFLHHFPKLDIPKGPRGKILDGHIDASLLMRYCQRRFK